MEVKLQQLRGKTRRRGKIVEETRPLFRVFLDDDYVGIVGEEPGSKFCPSTRDLSDEELQSILGAIGALHKEVATAVPGAPADETAGNETGEFGPQNVELEIVDESPAEAEPQTGDEN